MLLYHHCIPVSKVTYGTLVPDPSHSDPDFRDPISWLEKQIGFWPLFLAVGETEEDIRMTGYDHQWAKVIGSEPISKRPNGDFISTNVLRKRGESPSYALFSFDHVDGVFSDYEDWHCVLNSTYNHYQISDFIRRRVLKPSWPRSRWLSKAKAKPHTVQLAARELYLPGAQRLWVRNDHEKKNLEKMGFSHVEVHRVLLPPRTP